MIKYLLALLSGLILLPYNLSPDTILRFEPYVAYRVLEVEESLETRAGEILDKIAWCESRNDPKAKNPNSSARGLFQITAGTQKDIERWTGKEFDAMDENDSWEMAQILYEKRGCKPWKASFNCHQCL